MKIETELSLVIIIFIISHSNSSIINVLNKHPKLVIISFDGFHTNYLSKTETPMLNSLAKYGVSVPYMRSQFTTKTFPNHQSLVTGLFTENHGIVDNSVFDPLSNNLKSGYELNNDEFWNFSHDVVPIWILNEWAGDGRISGAQFPGADQKYGSNKSLPTHFVVYNSNRTYETRMNLVYNWLTNSTHPANLVFMYFEEPDASGHSYGPHSEQVKNQIRRLDNMTGYLINKLKDGGIYDDVNIIFWSDHGMQEVNIGNRINLTELIKLDKEFYEMYGGSPVLNILPKPPGNELEVYLAFKEASKGRNFSVYRKDNIPTQWHYQNNRRIMPIIVVADPGYVFDDFRPLVDDHSVKFGVHGYDNNVETMRAFFIAHGPAFKKEFTAAPFDNVDLFPLIASMMNFGLSPHNGTLKNIDSVLMPITQGQGKADQIKVSTYYLVGEWAVKF